MSAEAPLPSTRNEDHSYNKDVLEQQYGITETLAQRRVTYKSRTGEVFESEIGDVLSDERCPVGRMFFDANAEAGGEGVRRVVTGLQMMGFKLDIQPEELAGKKNNLFRR